MDAFGVSNATQGFNTVVPELGCGSAPQNKNLGKSQNISEIPLRLRSLSQREGIVAATWCPIEVVGMFV